MELCVERLEGAPADRAAAEVVERKGRGHPDSLCDALVEQLSLALSRFYLERFGRILHHNVDKALLQGGAARPAFGGGSLDQPIRIFLTGRAVLEHAGVRVPLEELAVEGSRAWLRRHLHALDPEKQVEIRCLVRPGSAELAELFARGPRALANDTSCGVGYAPPSRLERAVDAAERALTDPEAAQRHPEVGEDVKVMGVRRGDAIRLTVACALVDRHLRDLDDYLAARARVATRAAQASRPQAGAQIAVDVNTADDPAGGSVYLTVTGTSAEAGDDGQAGRGNRINGLITPYRPMTMESVAGKNPVSHVGKLYNVIAGLVCETLVRELPGASEARCTLVSQIGRPVADPQLAHVALRGEQLPPRETLAQQCEEILRDELMGADSLWRDLIDGRVGLDRWPLRR